MDKRTINLSPIMIIIGISGKKQSGKTTIAEAIRENSNRLYHANNVHIISFADALKEEVAKACGVTVQYIEENKSNFRPILQWWGTDFRRKMTDQDYWIVKVLEKITKLPDNSIVLIPDVRFVNEADSLASIGAKLWRVTRPNARYPIDQHPSETELDNYTSWDNVIENFDGDVDTFVCKGVKLFTETIQQHNREHTNK